MSDRPGPARRRAGAPKARGRAITEQGAVPLPDVAREFYELTNKLRSNATARSENDFSRKLAAVLEESSIGLATSFDASPRGSRKRPDVLGYRSPLDADLLLAADVIVESKLPSELASGTTVVDALTDQLWSEKTRPYITHNAARLQYFILTTFTDYACVRITDEIRRVALNQPLDENRLRDLIRGQITGLTLDGGEEAFRRLYWWLQEHVSASKLDVIPLIMTAGTRRLDSEGAFEAFAQRLAEIAAGADGGKHGGLFESLRERYPADQELTEDMERDLHLFVMCESPAVDLDQAGEMIRANPKKWLEDFCAAGIHSLISRLFALKVLEDRFCAGVDKPLIEKPLWVMDAGSYGAAAPDELRADVARRMRALTKSKNPIAKNLAVFGSFFDWVLDAIDPVIFRTLFELFTSASFKGVTGDLLGRFFEMYSQRINRSKRKALGQYYTPLQIVRFMWWLAAGELRERNAFGSVTVLDPAMGSATFLAQGARVLADGGVRNAWEHLVGFDISAQVLGVAQVNLCMAILPRLTASSAHAVTDVRLYTTDALDAQNGRHLKTVVKLIPDETRRAFLNQAIEVSSKIKRSEQFFLVIGNPPYRNNAELTVSQVAERFPRLLSSTAAVHESQRSYPRDDYAWFMAAADRYVQGRGMICFITSDSFLHKESYALFRRELVKHYHVRRVVRLGNDLFRDVGPKTSFVITVLLRRDAPIADSEMGGESVGPDVEYHDLRGLVNARVPPGSEADPRLQLLDRIARGDEPLAAGTTFRPSQETDFALLPGDAVARRVKTSGVPFDAVFKKKWPGIKTGCDELFKAKDSQALAERMRDFFAVCKRERADEARLATAITAFARDREIKDVEQLQSYAHQAATQRLAFDETRIKRSVSGSVPNDLRWYPPPAFRHYLYYEPRLHVLRTKHAGKTEGWGYIDQWRKPESHAISPKLIFTTSANPRFGYKAFVVDDEWYAKMGGGQSQQYNYTALSVPPHQLTTSGPENNLGPAGEEIRRALVGTSRDASDVVHYIAGIWNSALAERFLSAQVGGELRVKVPGTSDVQTALVISRTARALRDLHRLLYDGPSGVGTRVERDALEALAAADTVTELGLVWQREESGAFQPTESCDLPSDWTDRIQTAIRSKQSTLDAAVERLYTN